MIAFWMTWYVVVTLFRDSWLEKLNELAEQLTLNTSIIYLLKAHHGINLSPNEYDDNRTTSSHDQLVKLSQNHALLILILKECSESEFFRLEWWSNLAWWPNVKAKWNLSQMFSVIQFELTSIIYILLSVLVLDSEHIKSRTKIRKFKIGNLMRVTKIVQRFMLIITTVWKLDKWLSWN